MAEERSVGRRIGGALALVAAFLTGALVWTLAPPPAAAWTVDGGALPGDFALFSRRFASDAYFYPGHGASPLGLVGFAVYAESSYDSGFGSAGFTDTAVRGSLPNDALAVGRVGVRKGLPGGIDLGVALSQALGGDVKLGSAELSYALSKGGVATPALALRLTGTRTLNARAYDLDQYGAELEVSKGFAVLTPYGGVGVVRSRGRLRGSLQDLSTADTRGIAYAGLTLNLLLPKITVEVEKGEVVQGRVRVAFGF